MDAELFGKIVPVITAVVAMVSSVSVCLINQRFAFKKDEKDRDERSAKQLNELQKTYTQQILSIQEDYSAQIVTLKDGSETRNRDLKDAIKDLANAQKASTDIITLKLEALEQKQEKYNCLQERTFNLEKTVEVHEAKIEHIEKSMGGN